MRTRILALVALAMLVVPAASVSADTAEGGGSFHYSQTGKGADAGWTTAPLDGSLVPGVVYTDTWITVSEAAVKQDGTVFSDKFVFVDEYRYKVGSKRELDDRLGDLRVRRRERCQSRVRDEAQQRFGHSDREPDDLHRDSTWWVRVRRGGHGFGPSLVDGTGQRRQAERFIPHRGGGLLREVKLPPDLS